MTEAEWLVCDDPLRMLGAPGVRMNDRKLRLFAVACCRRLTPSHSKHPSLFALEVAERYADEEMSTAELISAERQAYVARSVWEDVSWGATWTLAPNAPDAAAEAALSVARCVSGVASTAAKGAALAAVVAGATADDRQAAWGQYEVAADAARMMEFRAQAVLLRDVLGNPFRPKPAIDPTWLAWNGGTPRQLADTAYRERTFNHLPMLADALEEAGCTATDLLDHCRQPGVHVRGCWVIDLLTGRG
jgi:hypothetical protein